MGYYTDPATRYNAADSGYILCTNRWYDPLNARWLTRDPIGYDGGIGLYAYCGGNPVMGADPSGFGFEPVDELLDAGLVVFDLGAVVYDHFSGASNVEKAVDGTALGIDLVGLLPAAPPGGGLAFRLAHGTVVAAHAVHVAMDASRSARLIAAGGRAAGHIMMSASGPGSHGSPTVQENRNTGNTFRDEIADRLTKNGYEIRKEVVHKTPFGNRIIDLEVWKAGKRLGGIETKAGKARYGPSQRAKDAWLNSQGYTVTVVRQ